MTPPPELLVETTRRDVGGGEHVVESRHRGHLVVVSPGEQAALGDPGHLTFVRSAAKPFQATACLELLDDAPLTDDELAVAWASHRGEPRHLEAVRALLSRSSTSPTGLTCPRATPQDEPGAEPARLAHNCSGKHALFALAGRALGVVQEDLLDPVGPLQTHVLAHLDEALGPTRAVGVDGCGAPAVAVPLEGLARGFLRLVTDDRYRPVRRAGLTRPDLVGGTDRLESALLAHGVVAKPGAEAVFGAAWLDDEGGPWAVALKVEDGASRAASACLHALVAELGVVPSDVWSPPPVLGGGRPEGVVRAAPPVIEFAHGLRRR